jgi:hypothetical protein
MKGLIYNSFHYSDTNLLNNVVPSHLNSNASVFSSFSKHWVKPTNLEPSLNEKHTVH